MCQQTHYTYSCGHTATALRRCWDLDHQRARLLPRGLSGASMVLPPATTSKTASKKIPTSKKIPISPTNHVIRVGNCAECEHVQASKPRRDLGGCKVEFCVEVEEPERRSGGAVMARCEEKGAVFGGSGLVRECGCRHEGGCGWSGADGFGARGLWSGKLLLASSIFGSMHHTGLGCNDD